MIANRFNRNVEVASARTMDISANGNRMRVKIKRKCINFVTQMGLSHVTFTNLKCNPYNPEYVNFPICQIKAVNRTHKYMSIYTHFFQLPIITSWVSDSMTQKYVNSLIMRFIYVVFR